MSLLVTMGSPGSTGMDLDSTSWTDQGEVGGGRIHFLEAALRLLLAAIFRTDFLGIIAHTNHPRGERGLWEN